VAKTAIVPKSEERYFDDDDVIVTKTDATGRIVYANDVFLKISQYTEEEALGQPHSIVRHPDMPRCVFKLLWDRLQSGEEIFAYVKNLAASGAYYWVFAHATPSFDAHGKIVGYPSNRRVPPRSAVDKIGSIYRTLLAEEERHENRRTGMQAAYDKLLLMLKNQGTDYDAFVFALRL
jgi:PAS domain S-box-containing protein